MGKKQTENYHFSKAAIYKIVVQGKIDDGVSERFRGMQIRVNKSPGGLVSTTLIGEMIDQTALTSILNSLYDMHFTVISVRMLTDVEDD